MIFAKVDPDLANPATVAKEGMTLMQLAEVLKAFPVTVEPHFGQDLSLESFRELLKQGVNSPARLALANFNRKLIYQVGGGHWSPVAAYHAPSDSALLMDVARYKYPPVWVTVKDLYEAVRSADDTSHRSRGSFWSAANASIKRIPVWCRVYSEGADVSTGFQ